MSCVGPRGDADAEQWHRGDRTVRADADGSRNVARSGGLADPHVAHVTRPREQGPREGQGEGPTTTTCG